MNITETIKDFSGQQLMDWLEPKLSGWTVALISKGSHGFRFQLQSAPHTSEETGEIKCITEESIEKTIERAIEFANLNPISKAS